MRGSVTAFLAAAHYWFPKMFGRMYSERVGLLSATAVFIGFVLTFLPQFLLGNAGMPRRYYSYPPEFQWLHVLSTGGAFLLGSSVLIAFLNLLISIWSGELAGPNPWGSRSFEWLTESPPPPHNFAEPPRFEHDAYEYELSEEEFHATTRPR
jgi:cytochrome c oxidase subunit 1